MIQIRSHFLGYEFLLYTVTLVVGIFLAITIQALPDSPQIIEPMEFSAGNIALTVLFFVVFTYVLTHVQSIARVAFRFFLAIIMFSGFQLLFRAFVPSPTNYLLAVAGLLLVMVWRSVLMHNIGIIVGIAGISAAVGLSLTPNAGLVILAILSLYDVIAVYKTRHMVKMAETMVQSKSIFGYLIPSSWRGFFRKSDDIQVGPEYMILGSGDAAVPLIFICALVPYSLISACIVALFTLGGLFFTHLLFVNQGTRRAMAALPPIAIMTILGYAFSLLVV